MSTALSAPLMNDFLRPLSQRLTVEFARSLIGVKADPTVQKRVAFLAAKANEGTLSLAEKDEYHSCILAGSMIACLQAQARLLLANQDA